MKFNNKILHAFPKENKYPSRSFTMLKKAWDGLPMDITTGERSLFIEIAEKLLRVDLGTVN